MFIQYSSGLSLYFRIMWSLFLHIGISLHPARPMGHTPGGKMLYMPPVWLHLPCYPLTAGHQVGLLWQFGMGKPFLVGLSAADTPSD